MDQAILTISFILLAVSLGFFISCITIRRNTRKEMSKKEETIKLKEVEFNELRMLTAGVTHEINNAIFIIMGRADQLVTRADDPFQEKAIRSIRDTSERIVTSVKGLRQFLYSDTKEAEEFIDLPVLIEDVLKLSGQRLRNHGIEIRLRGFENKVIKGRKSQLEQLIINLLNQSVERVEGQMEKWVELVAVDEQGRLNIYFMDSSGGVGDKVSHKQFSEILERNHGHLTINQNNLIMELPKPNIGRYHS